MFKKCFSLIMAAGMLLAYPLGDFVHGSENEGNIIINGDFEEGVLGEAWKNPYGAAVEVVNTEKQSGDYSVKISNRTVAYQGISQMVTLQKGRTYECSVYVMGDTGTNKVGWIADIAELGFPAVAGYKQSKADEWTKLTGEFKLEGKGLTSIPTRIQEQGDIITPTLYFDQFIMRPKYRANAVCLSGDNVIAVPQSGTNKAAFGAWVLNQFGTVYEMPQNVTWSLETDVPGASINPATGELSVTSSVDSASITVVAETTDHGITASGVKTVKVIQSSANKTVGQISISGDDTIPLPASGSTSLQLTAEVKDENGSSIGMVQDVSWEMAEMADAITLSTTGLLTVSAGAAAENIEIIARSTEYYTGEVGRKTILILSDQRSAKLALQALNAGMLTNESLNCITENLTLPSVGLYGSTITWLTSKPQVVSQSGTVTRQSTNEDVILTAIATVGEHSVNKAVNLCVLAAQGGDLTKFTGNSLFLNGNFEKDLPIGFGIKRDRQAAHNGEYGASATVSYTTAWLDQLFYVDNGVPYRYSVWIKLPQEATNQAVGLCCLVNGNYIWLKTENVSGVTGWVNLVRNYTIAGTTGEQTVVRLYIYVEKETQCYFDDLSVCNISTGADAKIYSYGEEAVTSADDDTFILKGEQIKGNIAVNKLIMADSTQTRAEFIVAMYDANGKILGCSLQENLLTADTLNNLYVTANCPSETKTLKIMTWRDLAALTPVDNAEVILRN